MLSALCPLPLCPEISRMPKNTTSAVAKRDRLLK
jgi:hypothetical protein